MEISEKELLAYLERSGQGRLRIREVARALNVPRRDLGRLRELVRRLEAEGKLHSGTPNRPGRGRVEGRLQGTRRGFGFVLQEQAPDVYVRPENMGGAVHGDRVVARLRRFRGRLEGLVEEVVERGRTVLSGTLAHDPRGWLLQPDDDRIGRDVRLVEGRPEEQTLGHKALVRLTGSNPDGDLEGALVTILGLPDAPGVRTRALMAELGLPEHFPDDLLESVESVRPPGSDELARREDLSDLLTFTIDPKDAKDHDDAVSLLRTAGGGYRLGVHIADVAHYVRPDSRADQEAKQRGTSVYLADRVVPMLPEILSNHVCSLRPGVPRLALSVFLDFDREGEVQDVRLARGWIVSRVKLSYRAAERLLEDRDPDPEQFATLSTESSGEPAWPKAQSWDALRQPVQRALTDMRRLARMLRRQRMQRGSLDIDTPELHVVHDARGRVVDIQEREKLESYQLIEEFMLTANQAVARLLKASRLPLLWRVHATPEVGKAEELRLFLRKIGLVWAPNDPPTNLDYQKLLKAIARRPEKKYLMYRVLRSLQKARYDSKHQHHFGLAFPFYTHFTSPIRRYPDLYNHRLLHAMLDDSTTARRARESIADLGAQTSAREMLAADAERASFKLKMCEFLTQHLGEKTRGTISSITDHGFYVDLHEWRAEGLVHIQQLTDDDYLPDLHHTQLRGSRSGRTYRFGQEIRVQLVRSDPDRRQVDLRL